MSIPARPHCAALLSVGLLVGCAVEGPPVSKGAYPVVDLHTDLGTIDGSAVLAAPTGWTPAPTLVTPVFPVSAPKLFDAMQELLLAEPRTWLVSRHPDEQEASFIVRSKAFNLADVVIVQAVPSSATTSRAVIFSRSRFDVLPYMSVNESRVRGLIKALTDRFGAVPSVGART